METFEDNLEFAASQAVDGTLGDGDRMALGAKLHSAECRQFMTEHETLTDLLRHHDPLPPIDFEALSVSISGAIAAEDGYAAAPLPMRPVWLRRTAAAAAVALTVLAAWPFLPHKGAKPVTPNNPSNLGVAVVQISSLSGPATAPTIDVEVGPSEEMRNQGMTAGISPQGHPLAQARVVISAADSNSDVRPY